MYYLRTKPAAQAIQFTVDKTKLGQTSKTKEDPKEKTVSQAKQEENMSAMVCSLQNKEDCLMCGS